MRQFWDDISLSLLTRISSPAGGVVDRDTRQRDSALQKKMRWQARYWIERVTLPNLSLWN